jgi:hypothetical protein
MELLLVVVLQDADYVRDLMQKKKASVGDVCRVFAAYATDEKPPKTAKEAAQVLVKKGWLPEGWAEDLEENASLGEVSYLLCEALKIKGGLTMRLLGNSSRYAYKECVAKRLVKANGPHSAVSGRDLLGIAGRLEEELEKKK